LTSLPDWIVDPGGRASSGSDVTEIGDKQARDGGNKTLLVLKILRMTQTDNSTNLYVASPFSS
jgi:hypothetical protein